MQRVDVASIELCRELYELSEWGKFGDVMYSWIKHSLKEEPDAYPVPYPLIDSFLVASGEVEYKFPAYYLGYLLQKLPYKVSDEYQAWVFGFKLMPTASTGWKIWYGELGTTTEMYFNSGDTPENATAKLCIELFRQNILKRDDGGSV